LKCKYAAKLAGLSAFAFSYFLGALIGVIVFR
jgi:hypothetical protein